MLLKFNIQNTSVYIDTGDNLGVHEVSNDESSIDTKHIMYVIYAYMHTCYKLFKKSPDQDIHTLNVSVQKGLPDIFNQNKEFFKNFKVKLDILQDHFLHYYRNHASNNNAVFIPSERNGIHLTFQELQSYRTSLLHHASRKSLNLLKLVQPAQSTELSIPTANYYIFLSNLFLKPIAKNNKYKRLITYLEKHILKGTYDVDTLTGTIYFIPFNKKVNVNICFNDLVNSLFSFWCYLHSNPQPQDALFFEHPFLYMNDECKTHFKKILKDLSSEKIIVITS